MRTFWQRWDIVDRLADERDAYVIPEVLSYAERDACMERRSNSAALVRSWLCTAAVVGSSPSSPRPRRSRRSRASSKTATSSSTPHLPSLAGDS